MAPEPRGLSGARGGRCSGRDAHVREADDPLEDVAPQAILKGSLGHDRDVRGDEDAQHVGEDGNRSRRQRIAVRGLELAARRVNRPP